MNLWIWYARNSQEDEDDLPDLPDDIAEGLKLCFEDGALLGISEGEGVGLLFGIAGGEGGGEGLLLGPVVGAPDFTSFELELQEPAAMAELLGMSAATRRSESAAFHEREDERGDEHDLPDLPDGIVEGLTEGVKVGWNEALLLGFNDSLADVSSSL